MTLSALRSRGPLALSAMCLAVCAAGAEVAGTYPKAPFHGMQIFCRASGLTPKGTEERGQNDGYDNRILHVEASVDAAEVTIEGQITCAEDGQYEWEVLMHTSRFGVVPDGEPSEKRVRDGGTIRGPSKRTFRLVLPLFAGPQGVSASVEVAGRSGTAGNRVVRFQFWATRESGAAGTPVSADTKLYRLLRLYYQRIPRGPVKEGGSWNNALSVLSDDYKPFTCGGYQAKVLALLDSLRWSADPAERELVADFDYGPIQAWYGGHQAVVLWPKGKTWTDDGLVLDPWMTQTPEAYVIQDWSLQWSEGTMHGIGPSKTYNQAPNYPTHGGDYIPPGKQELTAEEKAWTATLPKSRRDRLYSWPEHERVNWIRHNFQMRFFSHQVSGHCPVNLYVVDPQGRISGFRGGRPSMDVPNVQISRCPTTDGGWWTQLEFGDEPALKLVTEGIAPGEALLLAGHKLDLDPAQRVVQSYLLPLGQGGQGTMARLAPSAALALGAGQVAPQRFDAAQLNGRAGLKPIRPYLPPGEEGLSITPDFSPPTTPAPAQPSGPAQVLFDNRNGGGVTNNPTKPMEFTLAKPARIDQIVVYHWNGGQGAVPGTVAILAADGTRYGPWQCTALAEHVGQQFIFWEAKPNQMLPAGRYKVIDSDPATWSHNAESGNAGMTLVWGTPF